VPAVLRHACDARTTRCPDTCEEGKRGRRPRAVPPMGP